MSQTATRLCWNVLIIAQSYRAAKVTSRKDKYYSQSALVVSFNFPHWYWSAVACVSYTSSIILHSHWKQWVWVEGWMCFFPTTPYLTSQRASSSLLCVYYVCVLFLIKISSQSTPSLAFWMALQSVQISEKTLAILSAFTDRSKILLLSRSKIHVWRSCAFK